MIRDARECAAETTVETEICIVGGGTTGVVLARELIGQQFRVCLLESGGASPDPETQSLSFGENIGLPYYTLDTARARFWGGSSTRWHIPIGGEKLGVRLRPFDPIDFEARDWVKYSGWPFTKAHLDPYYDRAQAICRVEPCTFELKDWEDPKSRPRLPLASDRVQTIIYKFGVRDPFVRDYLDEVARAENITTLLHANVLEIETNAAGDAVTRLRVGVVGGPQFFVKAKHFVLALGGIETPRLLLLSNRRHTAGLGNQHDLVGRFFMEHPHFWSGIFIPSSRKLFERTRLYNEVHTVNGVAILGKLALPEEVLRREKLLNQNVQLIPRVVIDPFERRPEPRASVESFKAICSAALRGRAAEDFGRHLRNVATGLDELAAAGVRKLRHKTLGLPRVPAFIFANMMEQIPNPESRVLLGPDRDLFGQNRVRLDWRITKQDMESAIRTLEIIGGELERAGLGRFYRQLREPVPPSNTEGGYHHMGTTRMHEDPKQGVVDPQSRVHGIANLFIAGPSVFPTGGYANPVLTAVALTVRLADHLKERMR